MNHFTTVVLAAAAAIAISTTATAHRPDDFDGGKKADFRIAAAKNKARMLGASGAALSARSSSSETATTSSSDSYKSDLRIAPCIKGMAAGKYPCKDIDMIGYLDLDELAGVTFINDIWGWTDPKTRREYALVGAIEGMVAVDVTRPWRPVVLGILPAASPDETRPFWRDIKVYDNHAFVVSEQIDHGMQVFDLKTLRGLKGRGGPVTFKALAQHDEFSTSHNIAINEDSGYAYVVGANTCLGGLEMIDISDPPNPTDAGCFSDHGYIHDTQCVNYKGPDRRYRGREICFSASARPGAARRA